MLDTKARRGPEIGSDHYLVTTKIKENRDSLTDNLKNKVKNVQYESIKTYKLLNEDTSRRYKEILTEKLENWEQVIINGTIEEMWGYLKSAMLEAAKTVCGYSKKNNSRKQTPWWNEEVKAQIKEKKNAWKMYLNNKTTENYELYKQERRKVKEAISVGKQRMWTEFGEKMENNSKNNQKLFYKTLKTMKNKKSTEKHRIRDNQGNILTEDTEIMNRWREYFQELLDSNVSDKHNILQHSDSIVEDTNVEEFATQQELGETIRKLKNGKAPGHDKLTTEMFKHMGEPGTKMLLNIYTRTWMEEIIPHDWKIALIVPVHKKGDKSDCRNYRGITLLSTAMKIYETIIDKKLRAITENTLEEAQSGFRRGRSAQDHIFTIKQTIEKVAREGREVYLGFIDLEKAFDSVPREKLWKVLEERGINQKLLRVIKNVYNNNENRVIQQSKMSEPFTTHEGLRQGGGLSPCLFTIFFDQIIKKCTTKVKKLNVGYRNLNPISISEGAFADDVVIMAEREKDLQYNMEIWNAELQKYGMKINKTKTKVMVISEERKKIQITLDDIEIEQVKHYKYLGVEMQEGGRQDMEINDRMEKTLKLYHLMNKNFVSKREVSKKTKINVYKAMYRPILTYGCESWVLTERDKSRIQAVEMKYLRRANGNSIMDKVRNERIREELEVESAISYIEARQLSWWGHLQRMNHNRPTKQVWLTKARKRRRRGRPRQTWDGALTEILGRRGKTWTEAGSLASNRKEWAKFVHRT